jgi:hypothetical protein
MSARYGRTASTAVQHQPHAHLALAQLVEERARVTQLDVDDAAISARVGELGEEHLGVVDHEVAVEEEVGVRPQRTHDRRADGEVRNEVSVHHIDVQQIGHGRHSIHFRAEAREIG